MEQQKSLVFYIPCIRVKQDGPYATYTFTDEIAFAQSNINPFDTECIYKWKIWFHPVFVPCTQ